MTTLAADKFRYAEIGELNDWPCIDNDIIYEGAAVGLQVSTGYARPLVAGDVFLGFATRQFDNTLAGHTAGGIKVNVEFRGVRKLPLTGAVVTDHPGLPVYATDDDTFTFNPAGGSFIGFLKRVDTNDYAYVDFNATSHVDPWGNFSVRETLTGVKTFDAEDSAKLFAVTSAADDAALTLPAIATGLDGLVILAVSAFATTKIKVDPAAADMILGPDITGADNKDLILTKATQRRGDFVILGGNDADGYSAQRLRGIWAREA